MKGLSLNDVPTSVLDSIHREAMEAERSLNAVVVDILFRRMNVPGGPWPGASGGYRGKPTSDRMLLRMPDRLHRALHVKSARTGKPMRGIILAELAGHFGIEDVSDSRRPRSKREE